MMKRISIKNKYTHSVDCLPNGHIVIRMKTDEVYSMFLEQVNMYVNTLDDGVEKIDETEPDIVRGFGFDASKVKNSIEFYGDVSQVIKFCITYKLLSEEDEIKIMKVCETSNELSELSKFRQWMSGKKQGNLTPQNDVLSVKKDK